MYHSNQLEVLKSLVTLLMEREPLHGPFAQETLLVQSNGMAQWLQMQLAAHFGIAANLDVLLPAAFIWRVFTQQLPDIAKESAFSKAAMTWKLMLILPTYRQDQRFAALRHALDASFPQRQLYQLAQHIADLFDQYLIYRPDWIQAWQQEQSVAGLTAAQQWQAELWRALVHYTAQLNQPTDHRATLYQQLINVLEQKKPDLALLPKRLFIFGISSLPPQFLQVLQVLSHSIDVHLMFLNPCRHYWGDQNSVGLLTCPVISTEQPSETLLQYDAPTVSENPLLAAWGQQGRDQLTLLAQLDPNEIDAMVDSDADTLLHAVQQDILELQSVAITNTQPLWRTLDPEDNSLTLHACYSPMREVEALHDNLLTLLNCDPELTVRDIVVMVTDIKIYAPYIQAVFGQAPKERSLPFAICDQSTQQNHPILRSLLKLLLLPTSRCSAEEILSLLEVPAIAARFDLDALDVLRLRQWVSDSGICWGLDEHDKRALNLPVTECNTWRFGLNRMLLGYALSSEQGPFRNILPYDHASGSAAPLVGQLANFLEQLTLWRQRLTQPHVLSDWLPCCHDLLTTFFKQDAHSEAILTLLRQQWQQWISTGIAAQYQAPVTVEILHDALSLSLEQQSNSEQFLAGSINFCTLLPMRAIPFKVVCLLGMNDGCYPRSTPRSSFDLIATMPRAGDRSRSNDDRYLFLEAILSARSQLYISYVGRSMQDNQAQHPSLLVSELLDYLCQCYRLPGDETLSPQIGADRLRQHLVYHHPLMPFSARCFQPGQRWQSYAAEWLPVAQNKGVAPLPFAQRALTTQNKPTEVTLKALQRFYRHPVRSFFQHRLQVNFEPIQQILPSEEPFSLNPRLLYPINAALLNTFIHQQDTHALQHRLTAAGQLPQGVFGELLWQQQCQKLQPLASQIISEQGPSEDQAIDLLLDGIRLTGWLPQVHPEGLLRWQPVELQLQHIFGLWLEHLVYTVMGYQGTSRVYGCQESQWYFTPLPTDTAQTLLSELLQGWVQGQQQPLLLLPKCAWAWIKTLYNPNTQQLQLDTKNNLKAHHKVRQAWYGNPYALGEAADPYYQRLLFNLTSINIENIGAVAQRFLLPLVRHRQL